MRAWVLIGLLAMGTPVAVGAADEVPSDAAAPAAVQSPAASAESPSHVLRVDVEGVIGPAVADIVRAAIEEAESKGAEALLVRMDTPGGLDDSMRRIVKGILASPVPVIVYVAPNGSRAASAGVFITYAAHVAAMAPGTNLGAAHPVALGAGGEKTDATMLAKVTNDAVAYIRSLANLRGRNGDWAEQAVRESVSITADQALEKHVIDLVAPDVPTLLKDIDGRTVRTVLGERALHTAGAEVTAAHVAWSQQLLAQIANPNVAYVLMMLGVYGLIIELSNPGLILPGTVGAICLILALYAFSTLPVSYAGVALILLAVTLFVAEFFVPGFGVLTGSGVVALLLGSLMLMDTDVPFLQISWKVLVPMSAFGVALGVMAAVMAIRAHRRHPVSGEQGMIGQRLTLDSPLSPEGRILLEGEIWKARAPGPVPAGARVRVVGFEGLTALVEPDVPGATSPEKEKARA